jgi:ABC-type lipoprotein export system ATPase subunit
MSDLIGICGPSGSGKTTAIHGCEEIGIKGLNPEETVIINVAGKPLSFRG